ncbi:hypothetical protein A1D31_35655 [Bradyrhizobium liaoningense]|nr:hypothetical protein A1D31_35655 [Bradyrhizobium liaoningense]
MASTPGLKPCRYFMMVPRRDVELLVSAVRRPEMMDAFLRQAPHDETVVDFKGVPVLSIIAGLNWLDHCAFRGRVDYDKFSRTARDFRRLVVLAQQRWAIENAGPRSEMMLANREVPSRMFYLMWQSYTRLADDADCQPIVKDHQILITVAAP